MKTDLTLLTIPELESLISECKEEIERRKITIRCSLETSDYYDPRKHGAAYVALVTKDENGKVNRTFIDMTNKVFDSKRKYYKGQFIFEAKEGDKFEARLSDGSWKNESREYYKIENGSFVSSDRSEVMGL